MQRLFNQEIRTVRPIRPRGYAPSRRTPEAIDEAKQDADNPPNQPREAASPGALLGAPDVRRIE